MTCEHHKKMYQRQKDRKLVSEVLGRKLEWSEIVHHHTDGTLIVCEDQAYHMLLHQRADALKACGNASWRRCSYCGKYDDPDNLHIYHSNAMHRKCQRGYERANKSLRALAII